MSAEDRAGKGVSPSGDPGAPTVQTGDRLSDGRLSDGRLPGDRSPISPAALAYLGDAVIEVWVRGMLVRSGLSGTRELNAAALDYVTAPRQAAAMKVILPLLDEEEAAVFRRGRNLGHTSLPRRATAAEYRSATGLEALMGYLHLSGREERIDALLSAAYAKNGKEE